MTQRQAGQRFRQRKLSTKQNLTVLREHEVEKATAEDELQRHIPRVETGVEKGEEIVSRIAHFCYILPLFLQRSKVAVYHVMLNIGQPKLTYQCVDNCASIWLIDCLPCAQEHHLQAVISASAAAAIGGKVAQIYIPTPEAKASEVRYNELYPRQFSQPATYIRFSSTVEDCIGTPYCMTSDDEAWLKVFNAKRERERGRNSMGQCSEDAFEEVMSFFEATAQTKQPFAAVDNPPVISYDEIESAFDDTIDPSVRVFARDIYSHWKAQRLKRGNRSLTPSLKIETGQETDDADPYVCFRRREVRQARKTRGRDAQVTEKLKKLRKELEDARYIVHMVKQREFLRKEQLAIDRSIFEQRSTVKGVKRDLGVKGDDEDLINQKVRTAPAQSNMIEEVARLTNEPPQPIPKPSKLKTDGSIAQRAPGTVLRPPPRLDGRPPDAELISLEDQKAERQRIIDRSIEERITQHQNWNAGFHDLTWRPLTPPLEAPDTGFQPVMVTNPEDIPSPPPSSTEDIDTHSALPKQPFAHTELSAPPTPQPVFAFRTRVGRGGRLWLDRRFTPAAKQQHQQLLSPNPSPVIGEALDPIVADRMKYDTDEQDEDDGEGADLLYPVDHFGDETMRVRALFACGGPRRESMGQEGRRVTAGAAAGQMARTGGS